jgi:hypothetical protein
VPSLYCPQDRGCGHVPNALRCVFATSIFLYLYLYLALYVITPVVLAPTLNINELERSHLVHKHNDGVYTLDRVV